jgi:hypothetical protein
MGRSSAAQAERRRGKTVADGRWLSARRGLKETGPPKSQWIRAGTGAQPPGAGPQVRRYGLFCLR